ncbi:MAG: MFS transporter [Verrucomicrobiales bacterium]
MIAAADALLKADSAETRSALIEAAELARYRGAPVTIEPESAPETVAELAGRTIADASDALGGAGSLVLVCIIGFIAAHAVGQGTVIWVLISEIFPNRFRAAGQSLGSFTHWIFAALLTLVFPKAITAFPAGYVFLFFCGMMVLQLIWVKLMVPETKGVPLEDIERQLGIRERRR